MPSIIGAVHLIPSKIARARKPKANGAYLDRNTRLPFIGYLNYQDYLASDEWVAIRNRVLTRNPVCACCDNPSSQVHHHSYDNSVLMGLVDELLIPICRTCHESIELHEDGQKRPFKQVRLVLVGKAKKQFRKRIHNGMLKLKKMIDQGNRLKKFLPSPKVPSNDHTKRVGDYYRNKSRNKV